MVRRIGVGWDGSTAAQTAAEWALRHYPEAAALDLVQVAGGGRRERGRPPQGVEEAADGFRQTHPDLAVQAMHEQGAAAEALASWTAPDALLVLGGRGNEQQRLVHRTSTAYRVLLRADGPVAVVPQTFLGGQTVVVGVAGPQDDPCVLRSAAKEAAARRQRLVAVHAARPLLGFGPGALPGDPVGHDGDLAETERMVDQLLAPVAAAYPGLTISRRVVRGRPADVLLGAARTASLLVMGRDDASPLDRRPITHSSVLLCRAPVVVVPPGSEVD